MHPILVVWQHNLYLC